MARYDRVIRGGMIVDGSRLPRFRGDIGIKDGRVAEIGRIGAGEADETIDAGGLIVAPGFIDLHTHYDAQLFWDPYCSLSSWHGITSVVIGNCGFGFAPVRPAERQRAMMSMTRVEAIPMASMQAGMPWNWVTFPEFLDSVEAAPKAVNILPYMPISPLLIWVMGFEAAKAGKLPTPEQHAELRRLLHEAMDAGACGWSAQRMLPTGPAAVQRDYDGSAMPTDVMHDETCRELAKVLAERNDGFVQMLLVSGDNARDQAFYEEVATLSGRPVIMNVVQAFDHKPHIHRRVLDWLKSCRERGIRVVGQGLTTDAGFTFTFEEWNLFDDSEPWCEATTGTRAERLAKLADPARRAALARQAADDGDRAAAADRHRRARSSRRTRSGSTTRWPMPARRWASIRSTSCSTWRSRRTSRPSSSPPRPTAAIDYLKELMDDPYVLFGVSDGGAHTKFLTAGRYPTETLCKVVREHKMLSLEDVHWRLSALPAEVAGFHGRGVLKKGAPADIVVYDFDGLKVLDGEIAHDLPGGEWRRIQRAQGYKYVLVNGEVTIRNDQPTNTHSGRLLRHGNA